MSGSPDVGGDAAVRPDTSATDANVAQPEAGKTADKGAEAETSGQDQAEANAEREKKREGGWQRKIRRLSSDVEALAAERDRYKALAEGGAGQQQAQKSASDDPKRPRIEEFRSYEEYEEADRKWVADSTRRETLKTLEDKRKADEAQAKSNAERERMTKAKDTFNTAAEAVAEHYEDFDEAIDDMWRGRIPVIAKNDAVAEYIIEHSERGPELAYHLAHNAADAERIGKLAPLAQVRELAKLEATLPKPGAKNVSKAPPPAKQVGARGGGQFDINASNLSTEERIAHWRKDKK